MKAAGGTRWGARARNSALALFLGAWSVFSSSNDVVPDIPDPLTLEEALSLADELHPELELAGAALDLARAKQVEAEALSNPQVDIDLALRRIDPSDIGAETFPSRDDSWARMRASLLLYDFGRSGAAEEAAVREVESAANRYINVRLQRRLSVMARFFDVLLADLEFARDSEAMAVAYVGFDRTRQRHELGQRSDVVLLELESGYQKARHRRATSQNRQRAARARLALSLNRPDRLPKDLVMTELGMEERSVPEAGSLTSEGLSGNPVLAALEGEVEAAERRLEAARGAGWGEMRAEAEAAWYNRPQSSRNPFTAALVYELPLISGGRDTARIAEELARVRERRALLETARLEVREQVVELVLELQALEVEREEIDALERYRDLYLDRSRALYELEVTADLGDAMAQTSEVKVRRAKNLFATALAWAKLDALVGRIVDGREGPGSDPGRLGGDAGQSEGGG